MSRIEAIFRQGHKALIPYVTVGYPDITATLKVVPVLAAAGADMVELGIPFSDPLADGVTIQQASHQALSQGTTPALCLEVVRRLRAVTGIPLLFMTYYNPVYHYGLEKFAADCAGAGLNGLIIPDLPPEEGRALEAITRHHHLDLIYLLAPTSTGQRVRLVAEHSRGFIYLVSIAGVTGARRSLPRDLKAFVSRVRRETDRPLCVGFGIATPQQAGEVAQIADGVIVGSRIIQLMANDDGSFAGVGEFTRQLRRSLDAAAEKESRLSE